MPRDLKKVQFKKYKMNRENLFGLIKKKKSFLCVGLDSDINKIPTHLLDYDDPVFEFNKSIIDATIDLAIAYKPNIAFYESRGIAGWHTLEKTISYLKNYENDIFTIADAKRGDIGNTSSMYAHTFLSDKEFGLNFDAVTVAPYMGSDSVKPFLSYKGKYVILLGLTSNEGSNDFQMLNTGDQQNKLYETVIKRSSEWGNADNMMYVVGATKASMLKEIRNIIPDHFLLIPGIGAQGGSLSEVVENGINKQCGLIVNASRSIIFASKEKDFENAARNEAKLLQNDMEKHLKDINLI